MAQSAYHDPCCALLSQLRTIMEGGATATAEERYRHLLGAFRPPSQPESTPCWPHPSSWAWPRTTSTPS